MEKNWEPQYSNESHPNLLSDVNSSTNQTFVTTTMADYRPPPVLANSTARRKDILKNFYWKEFSRKFFDELGKMPSEDDNFANKLTTYQDELGISDFHPKDILDQVDPEALAKHPLYTDPPYSVYLAKIDRIKPSAKTKHPSKAFRRSSIFVRKWYDELE